MYNIYNININDISNEIKDIVVFNQNVFYDNRGSLSIQFEGLVSKNEIKYISLKESISEKMAARGLHHQVEPYGQTKIIFVERGEILDFFFNTNDKSKKIYCVRINSAMNKSILIPKNYAHGFIALKKTKFRYLCLGKYSEKHENTYNFFPNIAKKMNLKNLKLSDKDSSCPLLEIQKIYNI